jgi:hypothetical protein
MSTPLDNLEFETVKQLRKSLLITSVIGITIAYMIEYSTGIVSFFGFNFETSGKATIITKLLGCIVLYFWISFIIKFRNDELPKIYKKKITKELDDWYGHENYPNLENFEKEVAEKVRNTMKYHFKSNEWLMKTIDIYVPIALGILSMAVCFTGAIVLF